MNILEDFWYVNLDPAEYDAVCTLCREHENVGFAEGVNVGILLSGGVSDTCR